MIIGSDETADIAVPDGGQIRLHLFRPAIAGRFPGILFFPEIYQVTEGSRYDPALFVQSMAWVVALFQRALGGAA